jgi:ribonuclease HI
MGKDKRKKTKYYVVFAGRERGVFSSWAECETSVRGHPAARFKSYGTRVEAQAAFRAGSSEAHVERRKTEDAQVWRTAIVMPCLAVDAACTSPAGGVVEYRGVVLPDGSVAFAAGPFENGSNNVGEFLAIVTGLSWLAERSLTWPLYSDSAVAIGWVVTHGKCNTTLDVGPLLKAQVMWAETWLRKHRGQKGDVRKWETGTWGEIPADYGRK